MAADPLVSVVVPARNAQATLAQALDCLIAQDMPDWEAIIVDDASTDATAVIIASYAQRDARFRSVSSRTQGAAGARNKGIADGAWPLAHVPGCRRLGGRQLSGENVGRTGSRTRCGGGLLRLSAGDAQWYADHSRPSCREVAAQPFETFARRCAVAIHAVLIDRLTIVELGGFDVSLRTCEDWDLWQRVARLGRRWVMVDEALAFYRTSPTSLTRNSTQMLADAQIVIARGFSADSRVKHPAPEHAGGAISADGRAAAEALAWFGLWNAASDCGNGGSLDRSAAPARAPRRI